MSGGDLHSWGEPAQGGEGGREAAALRPEVRRLMLTKGRALVLKNAGELSAGNDAWRHELTSLGLAVLAERAAGWEPSAGRFTTYVYPYVRGAMIDALRREERETSVRQSIALEVRRFGATNEEEFDALADPDEKTYTDLETYAQRLAAAALVAVTAEAQLCHSEEARIDLANHAAAVGAVKKAVAKMSEVDQKIYELYYRSEPQKTLAEVARELGVALISARRYHQAFLDRLHAVLLKRGIREMPSLR